MSSILNRVANYQNALSTRRNLVRSIVGVVQYAASEDIEENFSKAKKYIEESANKGAKMVFLPEHFAYMLENNHMIEGERV